MKLVLMVNSSGKYSRRCVSYLDELFGQCWDGQGSIRKAFVLPDGLHGISEEKFLVLENTIDFLNRYNLNWRDFMTQCILSRLLISNHQFHRNRLQLLYEDCLEKDAALDDITNKNFHRREIPRNYRKTFSFENFNLLMRLFSNLALRYSNSFVPLFQSGHIYLDSLTDSPLFIELDDRSRLPSSGHIDRVLLDDNIDLQSTDSITEESTMSKRFLLKKSI